MAKEITRVWATTDWVTSFARSVPLYRDVLGFKIQVDARKFNWVELGPDEPLCKIGLTEVEPSTGQQNLPCDTGIVFETFDIEGLCQRLAASGVKFTLKPTKQPWSGIVANILDPDGNELQVLQHPTEEHYSSRYEPKGEPSLRA